MAITQLPSGRWQVKLRGSDGRWLTETANDLKTARQSEARLKVKLLSGARITNKARQITVDQYFAVWHQDTKDTKASTGWRSTQLQMYRDYVQPIIGNVRLQTVTPAMIIRVLQNVKRMGRSSQTVRHVYNFMHKVFRDAVETHEMIERNPVKRNDKPMIEEKQSDFFNVEQTRALLSHVRGKPYELAIWLEVLVGLRIGEIQALLWENVDLDRGFVHIRHAYVRRERRFKDYPKGRRQHSLPIPPELLELLRREKELSTSPFVVTGPEPRVREGHPRLCYESYLKVLKRYCRELGLKELATHGLRHSTSALWIEHGASDEDMKMLFDHSDAKVTQRYLHFQTARRLGTVASVIRLFPSKKTDDNKVPQGPKYPTNTECSTNVPCGGNSDLNVKQNVS